MHFVPWMPPPVMLLCYGFNVMFGWIVVLVKSCLMLDLTHPQVSQLRWIQKEADEGHFVIFETHKPAPLNAAVDRSQCASSTVCHWDVAQCDAYSDKFFPSCLAVLTEVHMPPSRQPLYLCLSVHLAVGLIRIAAVMADRPSGFHFFFFRSYKTSTWKVNTECISNYQAHKK